MSSTYLKSLGQELLLATSGCRDDMHEPDEQGVSARVIGNQLDNAFGEDIREGAVLNGYQELVVIINRDVDAPRLFNLATLIALARVGAKTILSGKDTPVSFLDVTQGAGVANPSAFYPIIPEVVDGPTKKCRFVLFELEPGTLLKSVLDITEADTAWDAIRPLMRYPLCIALENGYRSLEKEQSYKTEKSRIRQTLRTIEQHFKTGLDINQPGVKHQR